MTTRVAKSKSINKQGETHYFIEVYDQPVRDALVSAVFHAADVIASPFLLRVEPLWWRLTHRGGNCPRPKPMTSRATGEQTEPICVCLPPVSQMDYVCFRLAQRHRLALRRFEVDSTTYRAVTASGEV